MSPEINTPEEHSSARQQANEILMGIYSELNREREPDAANVFDLESSATLDQVTIELLRQKLYRTTDGNMTTHNYAHFHWEVHHRF